MCRQCSSIVLDPHRKVDGPLSERYCTTCVEAGESADYTKFTAQEFYEVGDETLECCEGVTVPYRSLAANMQKCDKHHIKCPFGC